MNIVCKAQHYVIDNPEVSTILDKEINPENITDLITVLQEVKLEAEKGRNK